MKLILMLIILVLLSSCITREEVDATIWLNNFNDAILPLCEKEPEIANFGFYRRLNSGDLEFISVCNETAKDMLAIYKLDYNNLLDKALPKKSTTKLKKFNNQN